MGAFNKSNNMHIKSQANAHGPKEKRGSLGLANALTGTDDSTVPNSIMKHIPSKSAARQNSKVLTSKIEQSKFINEKDLVNENSRVEEIKR